MSKIVVFGAGATGRGHVGLLAWQSGFELVLVDRDPGLVTRLAQAGRYSVRLYGRGEQEVHVSGYRVYHAAERETIAAEIVGAALVLTAVFDQNLPDVARTLALAVSACRKAGRGEPLNVLACENMVDSSSTLGRHVRALLAGPDRRYAARLWGFPDCMISRVVPRPAPGSLSLVAEDYSEWTARAEAFVGPKPEALAALELVPDQTARLERKLYIHNGGHAICGYLGFERGHRYIHEAVADPAVAAVVLPALDELGNVIARRHGYDLASVRAYEQDLVRRGAVPEMQDEVLRVVRDPMRKLAPGERLLGPAAAAVEEDLPREHIVRGIVAALSYRHPQDAQSLQLGARLEGEGLPAVLAEVCGLAPGSILAGEITRAWKARNAG